MSKKYDDMLFYAKIAKGYIPKVFFDAISTNIQKVPIILSPDGMIIRVADNRDSVPDAHSLWDTTWEDRGFAQYKCDEIGTISINTKHLRDMLKNIKQKDSITFFIKKNAKNQIGIIIQSVSPQTEDSIIQSETVSLSIQWEKNYIAPDLPNKYKDESNTLNDAYGKPMKIPSTSFQKIKKMTRVCKTVVSVKIQGSNYASFSVGDSSVMGCFLEFGELEGISEKDTDLEDCNSIYEKDFDISLFGPLVKLPGMCQQMEFYAPKVNNYPLKVIVRAKSGLCDVTVFIKDKEQIAYTEEAKKKKLEELNVKSSKTTTTTKGKKGKA